MLAWAGGHLLWSRAAGGAEDASHLGIIAVYLGALLALLLCSRWSAVAIGLAQPWPWSHRPRGLADAAEATHSTRPPSTRLRACLWPSRTTHTRLFPKKHSFAYSYCLVGVPVDAHGYRGRLVSSDTETRGWFHVDARDHLERDPVEPAPLERDAHRHETPRLRRKLDDFLVAHGQDPAELPYAYLVTAPTFLGYSFNPVSFWYLYSRQRALQAMILEVNNTFDERRMYLLLNSRSDSPSPGSDGNKDYHESPSHSRSDGASFRSVWDKDFHVSPFNSRHGSYRLTARDPQPFSAPTTGVISNDITLLSSQGRTKLVARVFSTQAAVADASITGREAARMAVSWGWIGFLTVPRILAEAVKLYFAHALDVFYRPEVVAGTSIARRATAQERRLEGYFARYLEAVVRRSADPLRVVYRRPAGFGSGSKLCFDSGHADDGTTAAPVELRVVTPAFYRRFVHYAHAAEALDGEFLCTDARNQTIVVACDKEDGARQLLQAWRSAVQQATTPAGWRWELIRQLRVAPEEPSYGSSGSEQDEAASSGGFYTSRRDIRATGYADMDRWAAGQTDAGTYRDELTRVFLARRLGGEGVWAAGEVLLRVGLSMVSWHGIAYPSRSREMSLGRLVAAMLPHVGWAVVQGWRW